MLSLLVPGVGMGGGAASVASSTSRFLPLLGVGQWIIAAFLGMRH